MHVRMRHVCKGVHECECVYECVGVHDCVGVHGCVRGGGNPLNIKHRFFVCSNVTVGFRNCLTL